MEWADRNVATEAEKLDPKRETSGSEDTGNKYAVATDSVAM